MCACTRQVMEVVHASWNMVLADVMGCAPEVLFPLWMLSINLCLGRVQSTEVIIRNIATERPRSNVLVV